MRPPDAILMGLPVFTNPLLEPGPKLELSAACPCSQHVRVEFNAWLLSRFGTKDAQVLMTTHEIFMAPSTLARLRSLDSVKRYSELSKAIRP